MRMALLRHAHTLTVMHSLNVVNSFYAVQSIIFEHLPLLECQDSCYGALSLELSGLIDHRELVHEIGKAIKKAVLRDKETFVDASLPVADSLLLHAARSNWPRVVQALLAAPTWARHVDTDIHSQCVFMTAERGYDECLAALVSARPNVIFSRKDGTSALHIAAQNGHHSICEWLVDVGKIAINVRNNILQTPLMYAVGSPETVSWFLSRADTDTELRDAENMSAFQHASQERSSVAVCVMNLLLQQREVVMV